MSSTDITQAIIDNRVAAYLDLSAVALLIYDFVLTLDLEIDLVWGTPWNVGRILFFLTRYSVYIEACMLVYFHFVGGSAVPTQTCPLVYQISGWFIFWGVGIAEFILIFRTWAIWNRDNKVALGLVAFLLTMATPAGYLTHRGLTSIQYAPNPISSQQSCFFIGSDDIVILWDYVVILVFETVVLVLTLYKGLRHYRHTASSLIMTLYKDGILYYVYLTSFSVANVLVLGLAESKTGASLILTQRVIHAILTERILLHLRLAVVKDRRAYEITFPVLTTMFQAPQLTEPSTVIIGVETWICEPDASGYDAYYVDFNCQR